MFENSGFSYSSIDRCVDELTSTLELAEALEKQLERVHRAVSGETEQSGVADKAA